VDPGFRRDDGFGSGGTTEMTSAVKEQIDNALRRAVEAGDAPGLVALAANGKGLIYEGAFGVRDLDASGAMTLDTLFRIASMTKAITSVAAMQLVEQGKIELDDPVPDIDPALARPQVLEGFDAAGQPRLRPAKRPITLRHLLTHTAGFTYDWSNPNTARYAKLTDLPPTSSGKLASLGQPLAFDPGDRWEYGINIDWAGRVVEALSGKTLDAYLREHVCGPLGMHDTGFTPTLEQRARLATVHQREADGALATTSFEFAAEPEFYSGGGTLYSTAHDYLIFLQMLLQEGELNGARILRPETVALIDRNHIGDLQAGSVPSRIPERAHHFELFPNMPVRWGLGYMLNTQPGPHGRSAMSGSWAGIFNSYYWLDPARLVAGVILAQFQPFADPAMLRLYGEFERGVYALLEAR
jgi:CubicO group peptidase (beta-lactamase class C family)